VAGIMRKVDCCSVITSSSATEFDRSAGIFATTATQNGLAATDTNAAAKHADCQTLIAPCTPDFSWFEVRPAWRSFLWRRVPLLIFVNACGISATIPRRPRQRDGAKGV